MSMKKYFLLGIIFINVLLLTGCGLIKADIKPSQKKCDEALVTQEPTDAAGAKTGVGDG